MIRFVSQAFRNYNATGAIAPSSRFLARAMVESMPCTEGQRILEVGCGTGAFTKAILKNLKAGDEFHAVEVNTDFCNSVEQDILSPFRIQHPDINIVLHNELIEEAPLEGQFDAIICGLPFNNFPVTLVTHIFDTMFGFLKEGGELSYFEYLGMRRIKCIFGTRAVRDSTKERTVDIDSRVQSHNGASTTVWRNIPSCRVVRLHA